MQLSQLLQYARPYRGRLLFVSTLTCISSLFLLAMPWLAANILGSLMSGGSTSAWIVPALLFCLVASAFLSFLVAYQAASTSAHLLADLRLRVFEHIQRLPTVFHDSRSGGDTLAVMTYEIAKLGEFLTGTLVSIPSRLLTAAGAVLLMFRVNPRLALIVPVLIVAFIFILKVVGRRLRALAVEQQQAEAAVVAAAEQMLEILPATKAFTREQAEADKYRAALGRASVLAIRQGRIYSALDPLVGLTAACAAVAVLLLAGSSVSAGQMTPRDFFSFLLYAALLTRPIGALAHVYGQVNSARGTLDRLQSVLDHPVEDTKAKQNPGWRARGDIRFTNVSFSYPNRESTISHLDLQIGAGEVVALVGPNGAGKTAIINLLMRFYDADGGRITLDGRPIRNMAFADLRRQIGLVPQLPILFNGTVFENIGFGTERPTRLQVEEAARLSQAHDFVTRLPEGFDTLIGDRGVRLSGGQRQRIALARALIKDPPILVFDEATSMFDDEGEAAFIGACTEALANRTVILVTHRPATLALANRILTLNDGRLSEWQPPSLQIAKAPR